MKKAGLDIKDTVLFASHKSQLDIKAMLHASPFLLEYRAMINYSTVAPQFLGV